MLQKHVEEGQHRQNYYHGEISGMPTSEKDINYKGMLMASYKGDGEDSLLELRDEPRE